MERPNKYARITSDDEAYILNHVAAAIAAGNQDAFVGMDAGDFLILSHEHKSPEWTGAVDIFTESVRLVHDNHVCALILGADWLGPILFSDYAADAIDPALRCNIGHVLCRVAVKLDKAGEPTTDHMGRSWYVKARPDEVRLAVDAAKKFGIPSTARHGVKQLAIAPDPGPGAKAIAEAYDAHVEKQREASA